MDSPNDQPPRLRGLFARVGYTLLALAFAYPLSYGPVRVLQYRIGGGNTYDYSTLTPGRGAVCRAIFNAYGPIWALARKTGTYDLLDRYALWCLTTFQPKEGYPGFGEHVRFSPEGYSPGWLLAPAPATAAGNQPEPWPEPLPAMSAPNVGPGGVGGQ